MTSPEQLRIRNVAMVAHVDHGKTTLVDAMLRQTHTTRDVTTDRIMDSNELERERGITILAKAASVSWHGIHLNLVDTPGHADFGGEVERGLVMVDGVVLLVDAAEGPLPQTRYVLRKAIHRSLPVVVVLNKVDRQDARPHEVIEEIYELFLDLGVDDLDFPVVSAIARDGKAIRGVGMPGDDATLTPLFETIVETVPAPQGDPNASLQALVTNLDASDYLGRLAIGRVERGRLRIERPVAIATAEGTRRFKPTSLQRFVGLDRIDVGHIDAGDLFVIAGDDSLEIGDTLCDVDSIEPLPRLEVDEPVLAMTFSPSTSPLAGEGKYLTSRQIADRLRKEALGNVSIQIRPTDSPDVLEVAGRGELQLAVLIETMRREGYEFQVSRPEVLTRTIDGVKHEPREKLFIDVPSEYVGTVTQIMAPRRGEVVEIRQGETGRSIVTVEAPTRGLLGFRGQMLTETKGTAVLNIESAGWLPWVGELPHRKGGSAVADRDGKATTYALDNLQERVRFFVGPTDPVYAGMIVGENARGEEMLVNPTKEKKASNIRTHSHDEAAKLEPPLVHTVESAIEFIGDDELVEVTPTTLRLRKRLLSRTDRSRAAR